MSQQQTTALLGQRAKSPARGRNLQDRKLCELAAYIRLRVYRTDPQRTACHTLIIETAYAIQRLTGRLQSVSVNRALDDSIAYCRRLAADAAMTYPLIDHGLRMMISCNAAREPDYALVLTATHKAIMAATSRADAVALLCTAQDLRRLIHRIADDSDTPDFG